MSVGISQFRLALDETKPPGGRPRNLEIAAIMRKRGCSRATAFRWAKAKREAHFRTGVAVDHANRHRDDFYSTPPRGTRALLEVELFSGVIWEPACGDGAISRVLEAAGYSVISTDLIDRGYGQGGHDFLSDRHTVADSVITNPPFKLSQRFVEYALARVPGKVAMLLPARWYCAQSRRHLMARCARVWAFTRRLQMHRGGYVGKTSSPQMDVAWFVWDAEHQGGTQMAALAPDAGAP